MDRPSRARSSYVGLAALSLALAALVLPAAPSNAAGGCPAGYYRAFANRTIVGQPVKTETGWDYSDSVRTGELRGWGCIKRTSATKMRVIFKWKSVGKIQGGSSMTVALRDCTTGRYVWTRFWNWENGPSAVTANDRTYTATVKSNHRFKVRITGAGTYDRSAIANGSAVLGHFYPPKADPPAWVGTSTCT